MKILFIGIICLIPLFIVPAYALQQYENSEYGFSINYPDTWTVDDFVYDLYCSRYVLHVQLFTSGMHFKLAHWNSFELHLGGSSDSLLFRSHFVASPSAIL